MATIVFPLLDSIEQASFKRRGREGEREKKQRRKKRIVNRRSRVRDLDGISFEDEDPSSSIARRVSRDVGTTTRECTISATL